MRWFAFGRGRNQQTQLRKGLPIRQSHWSFGGSTSYRIDETSRRRSIVEPCILCWLKEDRRLGTRFEKLAVNFPAMVTLAMIRRWFGLPDPSDRTARRAGGKDRREGARLDRLRETGEGPGLRPGNRSRRHPRHRHPSRRAT